MRETRDRKEMRETRDGKEMRETRDGKGDGGDWEVRGIGRRERGQEMTEKPSQTDEKAHLSDTGNC